MKYGKIIGLLIIAVIILFPNQFFKIVIYAFIGIAIILLIIETALYLYIGWAYFIEWVKEKYKKEK